MSATPRFVGKVAVSGDEVIVFTPPVNPAGNIQLDQGYYWPEGSHGYVTTAITAATITMAGGHRMVAGDTVDVWRAGSKIDTDLAVNSATATQVNLGSSTTVSVGDRVVAQGDLIGTIEAIGAGIDDDLRVSLDPDTGIVTLSSDVGSGFEFDFASAPTMQVVLRMANATTTFGAASPVSGTRAVYGSLYPSIPTIDEEIREDIPRQEYEADDGTMTILQVAEKRIIEPTVRFLGDHREAGSVLHDFEDFIRNAARGRYLRYYPDREVFDRFDRDDEPWGYQVFALLAPTRFDPDTVISRARDLWEETLVLQHQASA